LKNPPGKFAYQGFPVFRKAKVDRAAIQKQTQHQELVEQIARQHNKATVWRTCKPLVRIWCRAAKNAVFSIRHTSPFGMNGPNVATTGTIVGGLTGHAIFSPGQKGP
jgi:hypothetical protein